MAKRCSRKLYLVHVEQDVEPRLHGPYESDAARLKAAQKIRSTGGDLPDMIFRLNVGCTGRPEVDVFSGREMEG
jgi:hypothetical protein